MAAKMILIGCLVGLAVPSIISAKEDNPKKIKIPDKLPEVPYDQRTSQLVAQSVMNFAHNLAVALDTNEYPNTQIFSPLSVMSALSILQMGSYGNSYNQLNQLFVLLNGGKEVNSSKMHEEFGWLLEDVMVNSKNQKRSRNSTEWRSRPFRGLALGHGGTNNLGDHTIRVSNALFIQNGFCLRPDYSYAAQSVYKSEVTSLDFKNKPQQSTNYINSWVNQNTLGKIPSLIDHELSSDTSMVVASTLYFQGFWEQVFFDANDDRKEAFYPDGPESYPVGITFMSTGGTFPFYDSIEYNCRIIGLPYKGNQTTMYVIQPNDSTRLILQELQKTLTGELLNELISKMEYKTATLSFPKFHVQNKMHLKTPLTRLGIEDIFINGLADFALIADPEKNTEEPKASSTSSWAASPVPVPSELDLTLKAIKDIPLNPSYSELDRYGDAPLIFSRFSEDSVNETTVTDRPDEQNDDLPIATPPLVTNSTEVTKIETSEESTTITPLESITELNPEQKSSTRKRREAVSDSTKCLQRLDLLRSTKGLKKPKLYVDEIVHKIDFNVNEKGTEAAAATAGFLLKTGPNVSMRCDKPFLILVRHDPTKLPLFYGIVNIPA